MITRYLTQICIAAMSLIIISCNPDEEDNPSTNNNGGNNNGGTVPLNISTVLIPGGTFTMGSPTTETGRDSDEVQHQVTLSAFRMSTYEITNAQFATFLNTNNIGYPATFAAGSYPNEWLIYITSTGLTYNGDQWLPAESLENSAVVGVTWYGAIEFANYAGGRLPTEAEWEYACRGGSNTPFNTGNCLDDTQACYYWASSYSGCPYNTLPLPGFQQSVDSYAPNAFGLYNMHGNAGEWCSDWYGAYDTAVQINPIGPSSGVARVKRGGSWVDGVQGCRSAARGSGTYMGFRLAFLP